MLLGDLIQSRPGVPQGTSAPSSPRMEASKPGANWPIEPLRFRGAGGFMVDVPVSVMPYNSSMANPVKSMNSRSNSAEILSPPETHRRMDWKSSRAAPWSRTRPKSGAGSMHSSDGRALRKSGSTSSPPKDRAIATQAPAASPANESDDAAM